MHLVPTVLAAWAWETCTLHLPQSRWSLSATNTWLGLPTALARMCSLSPKVENFTGKRLDTKTFDSLYLHIFKLGPQWLLSTGQRQYKPGSHPCYYTKFTSWKEGCPGDIFPSLHRVHLLTRLLVAATIPSVSLPTGTFSRGARTTVVRLGPAQRPTSRRQGRFPQALVDAK